jgi:hypothetical protein
MTFCLGDEFLDKNYLQSPKLANKQDVLQLMKCGTSRQGSIIIQHWKEAHIKLGKDIKENLIHIAKWQANMERLYTIWFQHYGILKGKIMETVRKAREKEMNRHSTRLFNTVKLLCIVSQWWILVMVHLSKPIESTIPRGGLVDLECGW